MVCMCIMQESHKKGESFVRLMSRRNSIHKGFTFISLCNQFVTTTMLLLCAQKNEMLESQNGIIFSTQNTLGRGEYRGANTVIREQLVKLYGHLTMNIINGAHLNEQPELLHTYIHVSIYYIFYCKFCVPIMYSILQVIKRF